MPLPPHGSVASAPPRSCCCQSASCGRCAGAVQSLSGLHRSPLPQWRERRCENIEREEKRTIIRRPHPLLFHLVTPGIHLLPRDLVTHRSRPAADFQRNLHRCIAACQKQLFRSKFGRGSEVAARISKLCGINLIRKIAMFSTFLVISFHELDDRLLDTKYIQASL